MKQTRNFFITIIAILVMMFVTACGSNSVTSGKETNTVQKEGGEKGKEITIGYIPWDEDVAVTFLWKALLEEKGYKVKAIQADVAPIFSGVAQGNIDLFLDVWMPSTHASYMDKFGDDLEILGTWYDQADNGLAVPDYMDVQSIEDLKNHKDKLKGKIIGIEPGAGLMRLSREAIPGYGLNDWTLVESSTPAMLAELDKAVSNKESIVVTLWRPHWAFEKYNLRYLEDPKKLMNPNGAEELQAISRKEFSTDYPEVAKWLGKFKISSDQLAKLESEINNAKNEAEGVKKWISENSSVTKVWVE
ncbi:glycine betaine ABC transporter substrate-binding protein [Priestia abyssalis]|uniref:glycine betaine ABC transporter substrate-binding protein n=1 Tax=Priestia abyssalis TaxID=1221450 RepID=UPI0009952E13|nr:glycine betaine ABC transporter substrate-binding protein [Priestia abyssalis]